MRADPVAALACALITSVVLVVVELLEKGKT